MTRFATRVLSVVTDKFSGRVAPFSPRVTIPIIIIIPKYSRRCYSCKEKKLPFPRRLETSKKRSRLRERRPLSHCTRPRLFAKFDPAPPSPMEDRDISITTCMYVGESSKSRREGSFPPCEFRLTLTVPRPYPFPQLEKGFRFDKSCKSCTICASETKERRRSFPGSKLSANSCYPPRNKILLSPS